MANLREVARAVDARTKQKHARGRVDLELPIFEGQYAGRFGVLDGEALVEFEALTVREDMPPSESLEHSAEFIADACRGMLARAVAGGSYETLEHDDGRPVRFDQDFAEALELEAPEGRPLDSMAAVVLAVWTTDTGEVNAAALNTFAIRLLTWMQDTSREVEGEIAGG